MRKTEWTLPDSDELDLFLAQPLHQRGARLLAMTPTRRIAYAVAYARRAGSMPNQVMVLFDRWKALHLDTKQRD